MPDQLTDAEIALMCDIGEFNVAKATPEQKRDLERLIQAGFIERSAGEPTQGLKLTPNGANYLSERGAGLNEA